MNFEIKNFLKISLVYLFIGFVFILFIVLKQFLALFLGVCLFTLIYIKPYLVKNVMRYVSGVTIINLIKYLVSFLTIRFIGIYFIEALVINPYYITAIFLAFNALIPFFLILIVKNLEAIARAIENIKVNRDEYICIYITNKYLMIIVVYISFNLLIFLNIDIITRYIIPLYTNSLVLIMANTVIFDIVWIGSNQGSTSNIPGNSSSSSGGGPNPGGGGGPNLVAGVSNPEGGRQNHEGEAQSDIAVNNRDTALADRNGVNIDGTIGNKKGINTDSKNYVDFAVKQNRMNPDFPRGFSKYEFAYNKELKTQYKEWLFNKDSEKFTNETELSHTQALGVVGRMVDPDVSLKIMQAELNASLLSSSKTSIILASWPDTSGLYFLNDESTRYIRFNENSIRPYGTNYRPLYILASVGNNAVMYKTGMLTSVANRIG